MLSDRSKRSSLSGTLVLSAIISANVILVGCGKSKNSSDDNSSSSVQPEKLSDLKLHELVAWQLPGALSGAVAPSPANLTQANLGLSQEATALGGVGSKSREACRVAGRVRDVQLEAGQGSLMACFLSASGISLGRKINLKIKGDADPNVQFWLDNSKAGVISIHHCQESRQTAKFVFSDYRGIGRYKVNSETAYPCYSSYGTCQGLTTATIDTTEPGVKIVDYASTHSSTSANSATSGFGQSKMKMVIKDSILSNVYFSERLEQTDVNNSKTTAVTRGAGKFASNFGKILIKGDSSLTSASVDDQGKFSAGVPDTDELRVVSTDLLAPIESNFSLKSPNDWDCSGGEDFTIDPSDPSLMAACGDAVYEYVLHNDAQCQWDYQEGDVIQE